MWRGVWGEAAAQPLPSQTDRGFDPYPTSAFASGGGVSESTARPYRRSCLTASGESIVRLHTALLVLVASAASTSAEPGQILHKALSAAPVDIAISTGVLNEGGVIPLPVYSDGTVAVESECHWVVSPASQEITFISLPGTGGMICPGGRIDCYPEGRTVIANFEGECGYKPGQANFLIIAARKADLGRPQSCRDVAVGFGVVWNGEEIPLPSYSDGTVAQESDCRWIVNPASQLVGFADTQDPPWFYYEGRLDCYAESRAVVANYESDGGIWPGQATYLIIGSRPATTQHPGMCSALALGTGVLSEGETVPLPVFWDNTVAPESSCRWIVFRASQSITSDRDLTGGQCASWAPGPATVAQLP